MAWWTDLPDVLSQAAQQGSAWTQLSDEEKYSLQYNVEMQQAYLSWIANFLDYLVATEQIDDGKADEIYASAQNARASGQSMAAWPLIDTFLTTYQNVYPVQTTATTTITPEEQDYLESQTAYNQARVQDILNDIATSGQMTEYQQRELDLAMQQLQFQMQQAGIGTQQDWAQIELDRQQLAQQGSQFAQELAQRQLEWGQQYGLEQQQMQQDWAKYMLDLQASPADFIQRWYAERLPFGEEMPGWITQSGWNWNAETGEWEPPAQVTSPAETIVNAQTTPSYTFPYSAGGTYGGTTTPSTSAQTLAQQNLPAAIASNPFASAYTATELKTGILEPGREDPIQQWIGENVGADLTKEEMDWWLRDASLESVHNELQAEIKRRFGNLITLGDMRAYVLSVKRQKDATELLSRGMASGEISDFIRGAMVAGDERYGIPAYGAGFTEEQYQQELQNWYTHHGGSRIMDHQLAVEHAASVPFAEWIQTTEQPDWYSDLDARRRYDSLLEEAMEQGLPVMDTVATGTATVGGAPVGNMWIEPQETAQPVQEYIPIETPQIGAIDPNTRQAIGTIYSDTPEQQAAIAAQNAAAIARDEAARRQREAETGLQQAASIAQQAAAQRAAQELAQRRAAEQEAARQAAEMAAWQYEQQWLAQQEAARLQAAQYQQYWGGSIPQYEATAHTAPTASTHQQAAAQSAQNWAQYYNLTW
jgi:hypothetical protein